MAAKVHTIHSLPNDAPWEGGLPPAGSHEHPRTIRAIDRVMAIQRPVVVAHLRSIRRRHPEATPAQIVRMLERRYLTAVTTGGAAVGATAVVPGITTGVTLALSGVETVGFLESTTLFAQSIAEVHGIPVENPDRARALVLTLMLGQEGTDLLAHLAGQASGKAAGRPAYWGEMITKTLPRAAVGPLVDRLKSLFIRQFAGRAGVSWVGKALPFGIGAAVGGTGNHILARRVITSSRRAFGLAPTRLHAELEPVPGSLPLEELAASRLRRAGGAVAGAVSRTGSAIAGAATRTGSAVSGAGRAITRRGGDDAAEATDGIPASEPPETAGAV